jgi:hypothetical protein
MAAVAISGISFLFALVGIVMGSLSRRSLPADEVTPEAKDVIRLSLGVVMSLSALVLGLLVASAKGSYDTRRSEISQMTANVVLLDYLLSRYGDDAQAARRILREEIPGAVGRIWSEGRSAGKQVAPFKPSSVGDTLYQAVLDLRPDESQLELRGRIVQSAHELSHLRLMLYSHQGSSIPLPFLAVLYLWITVLFAGYSLMAPASSTTVTFMVLCGLSVSGAVFLILELDQPFSGIMMLPSEPLLSVLLPLA